MVISCVVAPLLQAYVYGAVPPVGAEVMLSVLLEHSGLLLVMVADGDGFTSRVMLLEAVIQVALERLETSGPTITRYIPLSLVAALVMGKLAADVPGVPILLQVVPPSVLFCHW